jgi:serralysin
MVDTPGNSTTTSTITVGGTVNNTLEVAGDHDWFRIQLTAGQSISVALDGITLEDSYLRIYNANGQLLYENDDISSGVNRDSLLAFTATYTGTYYVDVGAFDEAYAGTYQLSVDTYTPPPLGTVDQLADQLVNGYWSGDDHHFNVSQGGTITVNITALTAAGQSLALAALASWTDIIGVNFVQVSSGGQIIFDDNEEGAFSDGTWSGGIISSAHVNVATDWLADYGTGTNSYSFQTYIHEIGHALGLGHQGNYNGDARYPFDAQFQNDGWPMSVMSYFDQRDNTYFAGQGFDLNYIMTPMMSDILAMSVLYGLSTNTRLGDSFYTAYGPDEGAVCIFDSGGIDAISAPNYAGSQLIDLNPGTFSNLGGSVGNLSIAVGVTIENAFGAQGADTIIGNAANNMLDGAAGNDTLTGGAGDDTLNGEAGNDTLNGGGGFDTLNGGTGDDRLNGDAGGDILRGGAGNDILNGGADGDRAVYDDALAAITVNLATGIATSTVGTTAGIGTDQLSNVEFVTGSSFADTITGNSSGNILRGGAGNDWINGGAGDDMLIGDEGNDELLGGDGDDELEGGTGNDTLSGDAGLDTLEGGDGDDYLDGGADNDIMAGRAGNDVYIVDGSDAVFEVGDAGIDEVRTSGSYTLLSFFENLRLLGTLAVTGTGNELDNIIRGNDAANILAGLDGADKLYGYGGDDQLDGGNGDDYLYGLDGNDTLTGGSGYDRMYGGVGDDTYMVTDTTDFAYELAGEGHDTVIASIDHQLRAEVEDLVLTGAALIGKGNAGDNGITGNDLDNRLYGYGGNDTLDGAGGDDIIDGREGNDTLTGGVGYDKMYGGTGDDTFIVSDATDFAYEKAGEGNDRVISSVTHRLRDNIEELELSGSGDIRGYGNASDNLILGNSGANLLYGRDGNDTINGNGGNDLLYGENGNDSLDAGEGQDRFYGGAGADEFIFNDGDFAGLAGSTADRILDYNHAEGDLIDLGGVDANAGLGGDQAFAFIGSAAFTGAAGELRYFQSGGTTYVQGDTNGDGLADFLIRVDGLHSLGGGDFLL